MWADFQPSYNFFTLLLGWASGQPVVVDETSPQIVFYGPYSKGEPLKYPGVPKVYFTGESNPRKGSAPDTFLHLGFDYCLDNDYIRFPLWQLEINWFGADKQKLVNPQPVDLADCLTAKRTPRSKFCAFVATNPQNPHRNAAFHALSAYKPVDAGGRLFCNRPGGPVPAGLGGGGGELAKVEYYKDYKFAITYENTSQPGYTTEKIFHAKVAGCVPIYWGDAYVDRDFDSRGFLNANQVKSAEELVERVKKLEADPAAMEAMAAVPALSEFKRLQIQRAMEQIAKRIVKKATGQEITCPSWDTASRYGASLSPIAPTVSPFLPSPAARVPPLPASPKRVFLTAANAKYAESALNAVASFSDKGAEKHVYLWPEVPLPVHDVLKQKGASDLWILPTKEELPYADFWDPQNFAWKLWILQHANKTLPAGTLVLYGDAGIVYADSVEPFYDAVETDDILLLEDDEQKQGWWCHPTFCKHFAMTEQEAKAQQLIAGFVGFKVGGKYNSIFAEALAVAQTKPEVLRGEKWHRYTETCLGHRHDQSILSLLTQRAGAPRKPLRDYYCDTSMREARQYGLPLYVHRGHYKEFVPFAEGIGEAYVINLQRRSDRLATFKANHPSFKNRVYVSPAVDGRTLNLTDPLRHCFRNNDFKWKKSVMGCALSHLTLWEKLANDKQLSSYLIMEDDVKFQSDWQVKWLSMASALPADADVVYLGGVLPPNKAAFPHIVEPVSPFFAKVKANTLFSPPGAPPRRYFHFCNYAYLLTKRGANKLVQLVKERGIFTSGDHMIVNHGDSLLNIYFTTPLLATCTQEEDPVYVKAVFNDFSRRDTYDSDLWNNNDHFSEAEVGGLTDDLLQTLAPTVPIFKNAVPVPAAAAAAAVDPVTLWNRFLQQVATKNAASLASTIDEIFAHWSTLDTKAFQQQFSWFRIFEQLVLTRNDVLVPFHTQIAASVRKTFSASRMELATDLLQAIDGPTARVTTSGIRAYTMPAEEMKIVYHAPSTDPRGLFETNWLEEIFGKPICWKPYTELVPGTATAANAWLLYFCDRSSKATEETTQRERDECLSKGIPVRILHLSDEAGTEDLGFYAKAIAVFRNYWRKDLPSNATVVPLGYARARHAQHYPVAPTFAERPHLWSFAGSLDRPGRSEALACLRPVTPHQELTKEGWSDGKMLEAQGYNDLLRSTKFVPCFRGYASLESYRLYEALEQGAIPVYVPAESRGCKDEWRETLGSHPFLGFPSWARAAELLPLLASQPEAMEKHRQECQTWWTAKKAELRRRFT
jgi:GR25 family glycosyltransferase involved in LPS biosynthesis